MNSLERVRVTLRLEQPDRVPLIYQYMGAAKVILEKMGKSFKTANCKPLIKIVPELKRISEGNERG